MKIQKLCMSSALMMAIIAAPAHGHPEDEPHHDVEILKRPEVSFPAWAKLFGVSAYCEVRFTLDDYTLLTVTETSCTNKTFCGAATDGIKTADLRVIDIAGTGATPGRASAVYPLEFIFGERTEEKVAALTQRELLPCEEPKVG